MKIKTTPIFASLLLLATSCGTSNQSVKLSGEWSVKLDNQNIGIENSWYDSTFTSKIALPGCLQESGYGEKPSPTTRWWSALDLSQRDPSLAKYSKNDDNFKLQQFLMPRHHYIGAAWYNREIEIPASFEGKEITLNLERCHWESRVWVDGKEIGSNQSLATPHTYDLSSFKPGKHKLSIRIDNGSIYPLGAMAHSVSDQTQGTWNGIVGDISLKSKEKVFISSVNGYPNIKDKSITIVVEVENMADSKVDFTICCDAEGYNNQNSHDPEAKTITSAADANSKSRITINYPLGEQMQLWDEYDPNLYRIETTLNGSSESKNYSDIDTISVGVREFSSDGTFFYVNGTKTFLRGNVDCAVNPLTGYAPMDVERWKEIMLKYKEYGLNHIRFHSWTPPKAAFIAADEVGLYIAPEVHEWTYINGGKIVDFFKKESAEILKFFGNHPSFVMMGLGNESGIKKEIGSELLAQWRAADKRHLYTVKASSSSNPAPEMDYEILSHIKDDSFEGGRIRARYQAFWPPLPENTMMCTIAPQTTIDWREAIDFHQKLNGTPVISHELAQFCAYPDIYNEMAEYKGYLRPTYLEIAAEQLEERGMKDQLADFVENSGKWQYQLTKEEFEAALRTPNLAGFQWLGLNDFTGQNTAPTGFTDAFYNPKSYVTAADTRLFCAPTTLLARLKKRVFVKGETLEAKLEVSNHFKESVDLSDLLVEVTNSKGEVIESKKIEGATFAQGNGQKIGDFTMDLSALAACEKYNLKVSSQSNQISNNWDFWLYEKAKTTPFPKGVVVSSEWNSKVLDDLKSGKTVLLLPQKSDLKGGLPSCFTTYYWTSFGSEGGQSSACGIVLDHTHPLFANFATENHANWQWWDILNFATPMILDEFEEKQPWAKDYRPLVQPIDSWKLNRKLALVAEAKIGNGKLIICSIDIENSIENRIVAKQFRKSLIEYITSEKFNPTYEVTPASVSSLFDQSKPNVKANMQGLPTEG